MAWSDISLATRALNYPGWWFCQDEDSFNKIWIYRPHPAFLPLMVLEGGPWIGYTWQQLVDEGEINPD